MDCSTPGFPVLHHLPELAQTHAHWLSDTSNHLILCHPLLLLPSIFPSIKAFSNELVPWIRWPKYWSFNFSINPSNEYSGLISFRIDSLQSKGLSRVFSNTTVQKHQFFSAQPSLWSNAAAAKSLQSYPTLCNPIDRTPPGSPVPGILQARTLEWVAISFSNAWKWKVKGKSLSCVALSDLMDCSLPGSSIHGI